MTFSANYAGNRGELNTLKAWGKFVRDSLVAAGWTVTNDTGQTNWDTLAAVPTTAGAAAWMMLQSGDALAPYFVKISVYFTSAGAQAGYMTVGMSAATDGAGNLVGPGVVPGVGIYNSIAVPWSVLIRADAGNFCLAFQESPALIEAAPDMDLVCLERSRDAAGANTGEFVYLVHASSSSSSSYGNAFVMFPGIGSTIRYAGNGAMCHAIPTNTTGGVPIFIGKGYALVSPVFPLCGRLANPCIQVAACYMHDIPIGSVVPVEIYGQTRTYRAMSQSGLLANQVRALMLWE